MDKEAIAYWVAEQIMENWQCPYDEIEWLVMNLNDEAFEILAENYEENKAE